MVAVPVPVKIYQTPEVSRSARDRLIDAMDLADLLGHEIPCKAEPEEFTSDLLAAFLCVGADARGRPRVEVPGMPGRGRVP